MIARLPTWLDDLPADDFYRRSVLKDFAEQMLNVGFEWAHNDIHEYVIKDLEEELAEKEDN